MNSQSDFGQMREQSLNLQTVTIRHFLSRSRRLQLRAVPAVQSDTTVMVMVIAMEMETMMEVEMQKTMGTLISGQTRNSD